MPANSDSEDSKCSCCCRNCCCSSFILSCWEYFNWFVYKVLYLSGRIPEVVYKTDFRLAFILTAIFTSLVSQFRKTANAEADLDLESGRLFEISPEWTNHSISGGVSDRVLWNCRAGSQTAVYYKIIYLGLILVYAAIVVIYFISKVAIGTMVAQQAFKLRYGPKGRKVRYLEVVASGLKSLDQLYDQLKEARNSAKKDQSQQNNFKTTVDELIDNWNKKWDQLSKRTEDSHFLCNWLMVLYFIPKYETLLLLTILTISLTSYDIHPIGCLSTINISYNEAEMSVVLRFSDNVISYQRASVVLIVILILHWVGVKVFQFLLMPRIGWGLRINYSKNSNTTNGEPSEVDNDQSLVCTCSKLCCCCSISLYEKNEKTANYA